MNQVFHEYLQKFFLVFFDDILVYSKDMEAHVQHLEKLFKVLASHQLYANVKKCQFAQPQIEYLGHLLSTARVAVDPNKISTMRSWPTPRNIKELRGFLGLMGTIAAL